MESKNNIVLIIKSFLDKNGYEYSSEKFNEDEFMSIDLRDDIGMDSIDIIELVCTLESELGIVVNDSIVEAIRKVRDVVDACQNLTPTK